MREEVIKRLKNYFQKNADRYGIEMAFLYGSWGKGTPRTDSDIDLAVVFSPEPLTDDESYERITEVSYILSSEMKKEVNIIRIQEDFEKPMLYYNAVVFGVPLLIKDPWRYISLKNEAIYQMEDFSIFGIKWQLSAAAKNLEALKNA